MIEAASKQASVTFTMRHWFSLLRSRAKTCPATHQSIKEIDDAMPKARANAAAKCAGPATMALNDAAAPIVTAHPLGLCQSIQMPPANVVGLAAEAIDFGEPVRLILYASHNKYSDPTVFISSCSAGMACNSPAKPHPAAAAMDANPIAIPLNNGSDRRNPKCAPDAVAIVVAPPGVIVAVTANRANGKSVAKAI